MGSRSWDGVRYASVVTQESDSLEEKKKEMMKSLGVSSSIPEGNIRAEEGVEKRVKVSSVMLGGIRRKGRRMEKSSARSERGIKQESRVG